MSRVLLNMCVLKKEDIDSSHKVFQAIANALIDISSKIAELNRSIQIANERKIKPKNTANGDVSQDNENSRRIINTVVKTFTLWGLSKLPPEIKPVKMTLVSTVLIPATLNVAADKASNRDKTDRAPADVLAKQLNLPLHNTDALINMLQVKAGVTPESLGHVLLNLKNSAANKESNIYKVLQDLGIAIYDDNGNVQNIVGVLFQLANKFKNMHSHKSTKMATALGMDTKTHDYLKRGEQAVTTDFKWFMQSAQTERVGGLLSEEMSDPKQKFALTKRSIADTLYRPIELLGRVWANLNSGVRNTVSDFMLDPPNMSNKVNHLLELSDKDEADLAQSHATGLCVLFSDLWCGIKSLLSTSDDPIKNNNISLLYGQKVLDVAQQGSQTLLDTEAKVTAYDYRQVSYHNIFNITANNPEEVGRVIDEKISAISRAAEESFDDGVAV